MQPSIDSTGSRGVSGVGNGLAHCFAKWKMSSNVSNEGCIPKRLMVPNFLRNEPPHRFFFGHQRREAIQRAHDLADGVGGDAGIERRGVEFGMSQQLRVIMRILLCH